MAIAREDNVGLDVAERICLVHGFAANEEAVNQFGRLVDAQHAAIVSLSPWKETPPTGGSRVVVEFRVCRRDIAELQSALFGFVSWPWSWTISEPRAFFGQPFANWLFDTDRGEVECWIDEWVPKLVNDATKLSFMEGWWEHTRPTADDEDAERRMSTWVGRYRWQRIANQMLRGWSPEAEHELLEPLEKTLERVGQAHMFYDDYIANVERARVWIAEHPNGVDRQLVD